MILDPTVVIVCTQCLERTVIDLGTLPTPVWTMHTIEEYLRLSGWFVGGTVHLCPACYAANEAKKKQATKPTKPTKPTKDATSASQAVQGGN